MQGVDQMKLLGIAATAALLITTAPALAQGPSLPSTASPKAVAAIAKSQAKREAAAAKQAAASERAAAKRAAAAERAAAKRAAAAAKKAARGG